MSPLTTIDKLIKKLEFLTFIPRGLSKAATAFCLVDALGRQKTGFVPNQGAGGQVTQASSITTAVSLDKMCGTITTVSSTLAAGVDASFTLNNKLIAANDVVLCCTKSYGGTADGIPIGKVQAVADGSCIINVHNQGAVTLNAPIVLSFAVLKAVAN